MIHIPESIARVYKARQREQEELRERLWSEHLAENPALGELERQRQMLNIRLIQFTIKDRSEGLEESEVTREIKDELRMMNERLEEARDLLLTGREDAFCPRCRDTGIFEGQLCSCAEEILRAQEERAGVSFPPPQESRFELFDPELFSEEKNPDWYNGKLSPREVIDGWRKHLEAFCEAFPERQQRIYFFGRTGTGKSFLAAAVANRIRGKGYRCSFLSVNRYLQLTRRLHVLEASFNPEREELQRAREELRTVNDADCLILDDLGTESLSDEQYNDLIELLNIRERKKSSSMIITGNIEPSDFSKKYDERIGSRLMGQFVLARLEGPDVRLALARRRRERLR